MTLAAPGDQRMKNILDIDAVGLHPTRPAVDPQAGRLHDQTLDARCSRNRANQKAVVAGLVARVIVGVRPVTLTTRSRAASSLVISPQRRRTLIGCKLGLPRPGAWIAKSQLFLPTPVPHK